MIFPLTYKRSILSLFRHRQFLSREIKLGHTCHKRVSVLKVCVKICLVEYLCLFFGFFCKYNETKKMNLSFWDRVPDRQVNKIERQCLGLVDLVERKHECVCECLKRGLIPRKYSRRRNQIRIKRLLFAVEMRKNYNTLYGKLFQGLHIAESIFERHLREKKQVRGQILGQKS